MSLYISLLTFDRHSCGSMISCERN